jgi:hypothetical protein
LYPDFRGRLREVLDQMRQITGKPWLVVEGLRTPERQLWLYAQGRTRPGPKVTWMKTPKYHGTGLAADVAPDNGHDGPWYDCPHDWWRKLRDTYGQKGLSNPAWIKGDLGHVQLSDEAVRSKALQWVRAGFPASPAAAPPAAPSTSVRFILDEHEIPDAHAFVQDNHVYIWIRSIIDEMDWVIGDTSNDAATIFTDDGDGQFRVPLLMRDGRGFVQVAKLADTLQSEGMMKWNCNWDGNNNVLRADPAPLGT